MLIDIDYQLFLSICFVHPSCYEDSPPSSSSSGRASEARSLTQPLEAAPMSALARDLEDNLTHRRTERARNLLVDALMQVQDEVKMLMFKYIQIGVGARGVSVLATKNIIDAVKVSLMSLKLSLGHDFPWLYVSFKDLPKPSMLTQPPRLDPIELYWLKVTLQILW